MLFKEKKSWNFKWTLKYGFPWLSLRETVFFLISENLREGFSCMFDNDEFD